MLSIVERTIRAERLFEPGASLLLGVSGGADSMALLQALWELQKRWSLRLEVATVDHGLRPESGDEAAFVLREAAARGLPAHRLSLELSRERRRAHVSLMTFARERRRDALRACAAAQGLSLVALAHQADDQVETILFRLLRGTGLDGLAGMRPLHEGFVRPLLGVRRVEIRRFLADRRVPFVEDPSNADVRFARSRIRHTLLPLLRGENPRLDQALLALGREAAELQPGRLPPGPNPKRRRSSLREALAAEGLYASREALAAVLAAVEGGGHASFDLQGGTVDVQRGTWVVRRAEADPSQPFSAPLGGDQSLEGPGSFSWGPARLHFHERDAGPGPIGPGLATFDADRVPWPWRIRPWRPGDRMRPRGGVGSRKLSDLFIDARVVRAARRALPIVTGPAGQILFVPGLRPAEEGRPTGETRRLILIETDGALPTERPR